jgi:hypothetical protein
VLNHLNRYPPDAALVADKGPYSAGSSIEKQRSFSAGIHDAVTVAFRSHALV